uniref:Molybdenum cofactor sulfurase middle domain-containing protein n=1 Tax=Ditylenchus dipsaci TaxID=166011 RepID=A0A915DPD9_9BILA
MNFSNSNDSRKATLLLATLGAGTAVFATYLLQSYIRRYLYWNSKFVKAGKVENLWLFPIKSCKGKDVPYLDCNVKGCSFGGNKDRYFLVVDILHDNLFLTARVYPRMVLIESDVEGNVLKLTTPDGNTVSVDLSEVMINKNVRRAMYVEN